MKRNPDVKLKSSVSKQTLTKTSLSMPKVDHTKTDLKLYSTSKSDTSTPKMNSSLNLDQIKKINPLN